ncbi:MAG: hypothetical protein ACE5J7_01335 [Candidatus Aenigmatarchaeota archaeon]
MAYDIDDSIRSLFSKGYKKIDISLLHMLNDSILETQANGHEIIYFSGKFIGERIVSNHIKKHPKNNIIDILKYTLRKLNIGNIAGIRVKKDMITLDIDDCVFYKKRRNSKNCYFMLGIIAGMATEISGKNYFGKFVRFKNSKRNTCVFAVRRK